MIKKIAILAGTVVCLSLAFAAGTDADAKIKVKKPSITVKKKTKSSIKLQISSKNKKLTGYKIYKYDREKIKKKIKKGEVHEYGFY